MKKFFTLICALVATVVASAATIDDVAVCKHSIVINFSEVTNAGAAKPGKGNLCASGFVLDVTGGSVATNKGSFNPSTYVSADGSIDFTTKYAEYGEVKNTFRLKNAQDVIAMKVTAGSKLHFLGQVHSSRYPKVSLTADMKEAFTLNVNTTSVDGYSQWVADQDYTIYIGSEGGDWYLGYIIVEANEAAGTPSVKLGEQSYDGGEGMWSRLVECKPVADVDGIPTCCTYTTDGTEPTAESPVYKEPIKVYQDCTVKFQAFYDYDGVGSADDLIADATNEVVVEFSFDAPSIVADGANITLKPANDGATNYYKINDGEEIEGDSFTLTESATITAWSVYSNDEETVWKSKTVTKDVYVLTPITEATTITVSGKAVIDEEATAADPSGNTIYKVEDGAISADKAQFFVKDLVLAAVPEAEYQINGQQAYIQMSNTTIDFELIEPAAVTVICSKNSAKNLDTDKQCKITVDGSTYGGEDVTGTWDLVDANGNVVETLDGNVVKFDLAAGHHQFKKYSGTGAIKIASITIVPGKSVFTGVAGIVAADEAAAIVKTVEDGQVVIVKNGKKYTAAGAQIK